MGSEAIGTSKKLYEQTLEHAIKLHDKWPMVRGMVAPVKIRVEEVLEHDDGVFDTEIINGEKYVIFNVLFDTGACGSILDKRTWECYRFHHLQPRNMTIKTVMGAKRQQYDRNMLTAMTPEDYKINLETITIGDIGSTKRDSEDYIKTIYVLSLNGMQK